MNLVSLELCIYIQTEETCSEVPFSLELLSRAI